MSKLLVYALIIILITVCSLICAFVIVPLLDEGGTGGDTPVVFPTPACPTPGQGGGLVPLQPGDCWGQ